MPQIDLQFVTQPCPLCHHEEARQICRVKDFTYGVPGEFQIVRCTSCGHMYLNPRPSDDCLMACYPDEYAPHAANATGEEHESMDPLPQSDQRPQRKSILRKGMRMVPGLRWLLNWLGQENAVWLEPAPAPGVSKLLEIGCAHGGYLLAARESGWIVDGLEPGRAAAQQATSRGLEVFQGTLDDAVKAQSLTANSRDAVVMWMVLEHVPNPTEVVHEVAKILRPGGKFAISIPNASTWERHLFGRFWLGYDASRHLQIFSIPAIRRLLTDHGFRNIEIIHQSNTRYWWGSFACWAMDTFPNQRWPQRWMQYFKTEPPRSWHWLFLVPGKLNAMLGWSGRITVTAEKPD